MKKTVLTQMGQTKHRMGNRLWFHRQKLGYSQRVVAALLGYKSPSRVSNYERGNLFPSLETALKLEIILQTPISQLYPDRYAKLRRDIERRRGKNRTLADTDQ